MLLIRVRSDITVLQSPHSSTSSDDSLQDDDDDIIVPASPAFFPDSGIFALIKADVALLSSDSVCFYAHASRLLEASLNAFGSCLNDAAASNPHRYKGFLVIPVSELSEVINLLLHTVYDRPYAQYNPSSSVLVQTVDALAKYGMPLQRYIAVDTPLHQLLLVHARTSPLQFYALAAKYDLYDLAVPISSMVLSAPLADAEVEKMGPLYLARLIRLRCQRVDTLKMLLKLPPNGHPPTSDCDLEDQARLKRAWLLTAAYFVLQSSPGSWPSQSTRLITSCQFC